MLEKTIIPGQGWVYYGDVDTDVPLIETFDEAQCETIFPNWTWLGSTSRDNTVSLSKDGGDTESKDTWDTLNARVIKQPEQWSLTVNSVSVEQKVLELAFPGGTYDSAKKMYTVPSKSSTVSKAVLVVMKDDVNGMAGFYFPNGAMSLGDAPEVDVENFFEIQLAVDAQASPTTKSPFSILEPRHSTSSGSGDDNGDDTP